MIDISGKKVTRREAVAQSVIRMDESILELIRKNKIAKGNVLEQSTAAAVLAAKKTCELLPLCHPIRITDVKIDYVFKRQGIIITSEVSCIDRTGAEMEALTSAAVAALNIYDMCKMYDKDMEIKDVLLLAKKGGKSGCYKRRT